MKPTKGNVGGRQASNFPCRRNDIRVLSLMFAAQVNSGTARKARLAAALILLLVAAYSLCHHSLRKGWRETLFGQGQAVCGGAS
jgi:hypothetical protein